MLITKLYAATTAEFAAKPNTEGCDSPTHILLTSNLKPMNHETKAKLKAALVTGYIMLTACLGIAFFGRFIFALITN